MSELIVPVLVTLAVLAVPGLVMGAAVGARGAWLAAVAAPLSLTAIGTAAVVASWVGLTWSVLPVLLVGLVATAVLAAGRRVLTGAWGVPQRGSDEVAPSPAWPVIGAVAAGAVLIGRRLVVVLQQPDAISQSYDNVFHLNAVGFIERTGSASPLTLGQMTTEGSLGFYPSGWHALVSLVVDLTGVSIPVATNAAMIAVACVVWPLSVVLLTRTWFGTSTVATLAAGVFAGSIAAFPFVPLTYGVLYPLFLSGAVLPVAVAALARGAGVARVGPPVALAWILLLGVLPGLGIAHPSAVVATIVFSVPIVIGAIAVRFATASPRRRTLLVAGGVLHLLVVAVALQLLRPPSTEIHWSTIESPQRAVRAVLDGSLFGTPAVYVVFAAALVGALFVLVSDRRVPHLVAGGLYVVSAGLYVVVASIDSQVLRDVLTGSWYNNAPRLAALVPLTVIPFAAWGVARVVSLVAGLSVVRERVPTRGPVVVGLAALGTVALVGATLVGGPLRPYTEQMQRNFALVGDAWFLTPDEVTLLERLPEHVPADEVVAGNPWTGAGMTYAIGDRKPLMPHLLMEIDDETEAINDGLSTATPGSAACRAVRDKHVGFVLDFGDLQINNAVEDYPGLDDLADSDVVREVDRQGEAVLYEVVGC
ncbi:MAG: hypothetical protein P1U38_07410 [Aeromicrobium sp.]|uniref:DUF6541 family protein n=1 Tax=Aeromicrobium sp. TaxID=1871063 RepID=UPI002627EDDA|nr:DUF6541 family protein [Aeromicrobium sp.]MDF1704585.1 hypothetical protein [Aeromicrobium sp.]